MSRRYKKNKKQIRIIIGVFVCLLLVMTAGYAAFSTNITLTAKGNIKDLSRVIQSWTYDSTSDFHSEFYKENIVTATFLNTNTVPSNATESWDVSEDGKGGVKAYVTINEEETTTSGSTKYDLYIGAKDGVIANEDSSYLFYNFINLSSIKFDSNFDTKNVTHMRSMFRSCLNLNSLNLTNFDTSSVINMSAMISMYYPGATYGDDSIVPKLSEIIFGENFNTSNVIAMDSMFAYNKTLVNITGLEYFNTSNVISMKSIFDVCKNLIELDLSSFNTYNVNNMSYMFNQNNKLKTIYASNDFVTTNVTTSTYMFGSTTSLVGGNGTIFIWEQMEKEYARIDTASTPGYFTLKTN